MNSPLSRRQALAATLACGSTLVAGPVRAAELAGKDVGRKLNADGTVHPFVGNTFIGHVPQQGEGYETFDTLLDIYREVPRHSFAHKLMLLPPSSYHVTVFGALNEVDRGTRDWPQALPADIGLPAVTQRWLELLRGRPKLDPAPFDFVPDVVTRKIDGAPNIPLRPANAATAARLATLRDELSNLTGIRRVDHDSYLYHLTFGYLRRHLTSTEADDLMRATSRWTAALPPRIRIPAFHFCSFRDMFSFRELHAL
ncbi:DUF1868 domain-containing protein [Pelomonas sp. HMWF004]|nr:DUF1868 domain-containing protein [Pelomonas sp. HMWF004]